MQMQRLVAALVAPALICLVLVAGQVAETHEVSTFESEKLAAPSLQLDFATFRAKFNKHYESSLEASRRAKLFVARSLEALQSRISYALKLAPWYKSVNDFSDRTDTEIVADLLQPLERFEQQYRELDKVVAPLNMTSDLGLLSSSKSGEQDAEDAGSESFVPTRRRGFLTFLKRKKFHDLSGCLPAAKNQRKCGACYAFTTLAMFEFFLCRQLGRPVALSEQYIINCGFKVGSGGCFGGNMYGAANFIGLHGVELAENWPLERKALQCRYSDRRDKYFDLLAAGYYRLENTTTSTALSISAVKTSMFEEALEHGLPIYVSLSLDVLAMAQYGGGLICPPYRTGNKSTGHAVLVVGSGRENGREYWLVRNSYGPEWGLDGYMRLSKQCPLSVIYQNRGFVINSPDKFKFVKNPEYKKFGIFYSEA